MAVNDRARRRLRGWSVWLGVGPLVATLGLVVLGPELPPVVEYGVLIAGGLTIGLPHGAVDWAALPLARRGRLARRDVALVGLCYLALGGLALLAWVVAPVAAAVGFLLLTWFHWGQGDRYALAEQYDKGPGVDRRQAGLIVLVRGGMPMVLPLLAFPETYRAVLRTFVEPFGVAAALDWLLVPGTRLALGAGLAIATLVALARPRWRGADRRAWRLDVLETGTLWAAFLLVPPVLAIGVYFATWHSWRHVARVLLLDEASVVALAEGNPIRSAVRFGIAAAIPTLAALAIAGGLWLVVPDPPRSVPGLVGLGLVAIAVLTLPHVAVVTWLDRLETA